MSEKLTISKFLGFANENGENFVLEFDSFYVLQNLREDSRRFTVFHLHLKGLALSWFNSLSDDIIDKWTSLKSAFKFQYVKTRAW